MAKTIIIKIHIHWRKNELLIPKESLMKNTT